MYLHVQSGPALEAPAARPPEGRVARRLGRGLALRREALLTLTLAGGLLAGHLLYYARLIGFDAVDDAYISFRYALNWAQGFGPVFNPGERVEGYTNFLWVAVLRAGAGLGLDIPPLSLVLGALLALATILLLWGSARRRDRLASTLAVFLLAGDGSFALWAVSGLETALFALLVLAGALALLRELERGGFPWSGLLFALAGMARPEGVLVFGLSMAYLALFRLARRDRRPGLADAGRLLLFAGAYGGYFLWRYRYYGFLLPNTFYAKVELETPAAQIDRGFRHLKTFLGVHGGLLLPALMAVPFAAGAVNWLRRDRSQRRLGAAMRALFEPGWAPRSYGLLLTVAYAAYIVYVGGDWSIGRFFVPVLPFAYLLAGEGLAQLLRLAWTALRPRQAALPAAGLLAVGVLLCLATAYASSYRGERQLYVLPYEVRLASQARKAAGEWLRRNAAPDALLAVDAAGQMPYWSGLRAIDLFGLTDTYVAHKRMTVGKGAAGHEKTDLAYIYSRQPDYFVIYGRMLDNFPDLFTRVTDWTSDPSFDRYLGVYRRN